MKIKQIFLKLAIFVIALMPLAVFAFVSLPQETALAACGPRYVEVDEISTECHQQNYDEVKGQIGIVEFNELTKECGNTGYCSNAISSCLRLVSEVDKCRDQKVLKGIAEECDAGEVSEAEICDPIARANGDSLNVRGDAFEEGIREACAKHQGNVELYRSCLQAARNAAPECNGELGLDVNENGDVHWDQDIGSWNGENQGLIRKFDLGAYDDCLKRKVREDIKDPKLCEDVGGKWNEETKSCDAPPPPPSPEDQCDQKFPNPDQQAEREACMACVNDPNAASNYANDPKLKAACASGTDIKNKVAGGPGAGYRATTGKCGPDVRVNILVCGEEGGNVALQNLLRIGVIVLSMLVGAAALGGLAYSAITYARAADNQQTVSEAKDRIRNIVIGLFLYGFIIAIINWLVPGGIL